MRTILHVDQLENRDTPATLLAHEAPTILAENVHGEIQHVLHCDVVQLFDHFNERESTTCTATEVEGGQMLHFDNIYNDLWINIDGAEQLLPGGSMDIFVGEGAEVKMHDLNQVIALDPLDAIATPIVVQECDEEGHMEVIHTIGECLESLEHAKHAHHAHTDHEHAHEHTHAHGEHEHAHVHEHQHEHEHEHEHEAEEEGHEGKVVEDSGGMPNVDAEMLLRNGHRIPGEMNGKNGKHHAEKHGAQDEKPRTEQKHVTENKPKDAQKPATEAQSAEPPLAAPQQSQLPSSSDEKKPAPQENGPRMDDDHQETSISSIMLAGAMLGSVAAKKPSMWRRLRNWFSAAA